MPAYRVLSFSIRPHSIALKVEEEADYPDTNSISHEKNGAAICVLGMPEKIIKFKSLDFVWKGDELTNQYVFVIEHVAFPIEDLIGRIIVSS